MNLAIDVETTKLPNIFPWNPLAYLVCVSTASESGETKTWFFNHETHRDGRTHAQCVKEIQYEIDSHSRLIAHNLKFDSHWLRFIGVDVSRTMLYCTMVGEYMLRGHDKQEGLGLTAISSRYGIPPKKDKVKIYWDADRETDTIPAHVLQPYCEQDAVNALHIASRQMRLAVKQNQTTLLSLEMEVLRVISEMEYNGMMLDKAKLEEYTIRYGELLEETDRKLCDELGIENPGSPQQLSKGLFGYPPENLSGIFIPKDFGIDATKTEHIFSTAKDTLAKLKGRTPKQKEIIELLHERSKYGQLQSMYFEGLQKHMVNGIVHPSINQTVTKTGRTSCSQPNLQNQPRGNTGPVKSCFITRY